MYILNLEDNVFKHHDICDAVAKGSFGNLKIDFVRGSSYEKSQRKRLEHSNHPVLVCELPDSGNTWLCPLLGE